MNNFNIQQYIPSINPDYWDSWGEAIKIGGAKAAAVKGLGATSAMGAKAAMGLEGGAGLATGFGSFAMEMAREDCRYSN